MRRHRIVQFLLIVCVAIMLSSCGGTSRTSGKPNGIYGNSEIYMTYTFNNDEFSYWFLGKEESGTWTMKNDEVKLSFYGGKEDTLTYDKEKDILDLYGAAEFKKISEKEFKELVKNGESIAASVSNNNSKKYFDERPDIETPDSYDSAITLHSKEGGTYLYSLGYDKDKAAETTASYLAYLESEGYISEDITDKVSNEGVIVFSLKENGKTDGLLVYSHIQGEGYAMGVSWN